MKSNLTLPAIRIKLTGVCNRTCSFCHGEGGMNNIEDVIIDDNFFECIKKIMDKTAIKRIMLTGGEPMLYPELNKIVSELRKFSDKISITTNGIKEISAQKWQSLKEDGISEVVISIHDTSAQDLLDLESKNKSLSWAENALKNQFINIENAASVISSVRINIVAYNTFEKTCESVKRLLEIQKKGQPEIRLLNNLSSIVESHQVINKIITELGAKKIDSSQRAGSSNVTNHFMTSEGKILSVKMAFPYYLEAICNLCQIKDKCYEGFYGIRIERLKGEYYVRLCIYKQSQDILIPWKKFIDTNISEEIKNNSVIP